MNNIAGALCSLYETGAEKGAGEENVFICNIIEQKWSLK